MVARTLMIQGTASTVGKSILVTALCRIFKQDGLRVAPFKSQNMALNSFVTREGLEIGRAQAVQAEAAGIEPTVDMNPVLIKPESDTRSQIVVMGKPDRSLQAEAYYRHTGHLLDIVGAALDRLRSAYDLVIIEGAGSPAEVNLRDSEIVNMRIAAMAGAPVILVGDIDRGGVFASLLGTLALLEQHERERIKAFIINKFRGDVTLLKPALDLLEERTSRPVLGVVPYIHGMAIAQEDSVYLDERPQAPETPDLDIAVIQFPYTSNYDDFDPLEWEGCRVRYAAAVSQLGSPHLIVLPGTKNTAKDLAYIRSTGLAEAITQLAERGTPIIGICGGYQMLGRSLHDPDEVESDAGPVLGLGLLDMRTHFVNEKTTSQVRCRVAVDRGLLCGMQGREVIGYQIHMGRTEVNEKDSPFLMEETPQGAAADHDGMISADGNILGTYIHGLFHNQGFRQAFLNNLRRGAGLPEKWGAPPVDKDREYDRLASVVRECLDMTAIRRIIG